MGEIVPRLNITRTVGGRLVTLHLRTATLKYNSKSWNSYLLPTAIGMKRPLW
jgi:hypothetical protein